MHVTLFKEVKMAGTARCVASLMHLVFKKRGVVEIIPPRFKERGVF